MLRRLHALVVLLAVATPAAAADLYVNNSGSPACDDGTSKASNSAEAPWCTILRAVVGSTTRSSPNAGEAADAGDTVYVTGGTYDYTGTCTAGSSCRFDVLYNPVNEGSSGNMIRVVCLGTCTTTADAWNGPVLGSNGRDFVWWYANRVSGAIWNVPVCFENPAAGDDCGTGTAAAVPDTGAVVIANATSAWVEGFNITGTAPATYVDNVNGVRIEDATDARVLNTRIRDITRTGDYNHNQSCVTIYDSPSAIVEHLDCANAGSGVFFKDNNSAGTAHGGTIVRFSRIDSVNEGIAHSLVGPLSVETGGARIYQNLLTNVNNCWRVVGDDDDGPEDEWFINNTCVTVAQAAYDIGTTLDMAGARVWNNIVTSSADVIIVAEAAMFADTVIDFEHNVYADLLADFFNPSGTDQSFATFVATYADQEQAAPASTVSDPLFANAAGGDYRLCTAAGVPHASCSGASPAIGRGVDALDLDGDSSTSDTINAGAYVSGSEVIGLVTTDGSSGQPVRTLRIRGGEDRR